MSKSIKFLILAVVVVPLSIAVAVSAWVEGALITAIIWSILTVAWGCGFIGLALKFRKPRKEDRKPQIIKRLAVWEKTIHLFVLTIAIACLGIKVYTGAPPPLHFLLGCACMIAVSGGILLCGGVSKE